MPKHKSFKEPDELREYVELKRVAPDRKLAVGLDFGRSTGMAFTWFTPGKPFILGQSPIYMGQLDLTMGEWDNSPARIARLRTFLSTMDPDMIAFEDVNYTPAGSDFAMPSIAAVIARAAKAIEWFGALKAVTTQWGLDRGVPTFAMGIGTIKKRATGKGNANKGAVITACNEELLTNLDPIDYDASGDDNIADAAFCLLLSLEQYARGIRDDTQPAPPTRTRPAAEPAP